MKTLSITTPIGQTFLRSVLYLSLFCAVLELFARTPAARTWFPHESYGTSHPHFELQLVRLRERVARGESVDCIFIGNSQVLYASTRKWSMRPIAKPAGAISTAKTSGWAG